jgi:hypothetical protein
MQTLSPKPPLWTILAIAAVLVLMVLLLSCSGPRYTHGCCNVKGSVGYAPYVPQKIKLKN